MKKTSFEVTGTKLMVSDPCYNRGTWCQKVVENVLPGKWEAYTSTIDAGAWGRRVASLSAVHVDSVDSTPAESFEIGVYTGQAGVFDEARYPQGDTGEYGETDTFYGRACAANHDNRKNDEQDEPAYIDEGALSSSGYGDGGYTATVHRDKDGRATVIEIVFIDEVTQDYAAMRQVQHHLPENNEARSRFSVTNMLRIGTILGTKKYRDHLDESSTNALLQAMHQLSDFAHGRYIQSPLLLNLEKLKDK